MTDTPTGTASLTERLDKTISMMGDNMFRGLFIESRDALEAAERVIAPFAAIGNELHENLADTNINTMAWAVPQVGTFRAARDWLAAHATGQRNDVPQQHDWGPSQVGHGEQQCRRCLMTNREAAALRMLDECNFATGQHCSTCSDTGVIDQRLGGEPTSDTVPCPDCATGQRQGGDDEQG